MTELKLAWPVARTTPVTQGFGENAHVYARFGLAGHNGLDFGLPAGTPVQAAADGVVTQAEAVDRGGYGCHVRLLHEDGRVTIYGHLARPMVKTGQAVRANEKIGLSGNSGFSTGPHLHFEVRLPGQEQNGYGGAVDPLPLLEAGRMSLPVNPDFPESEQWLVSTALNMRLQPSFNHTLRGCLRTGDVVTLAGPQEVTENGFCFVPVVVWVAKAYLMPLAYGSWKSDKNTKISTSSTTYPQILASYPQF